VAVLGWACAILLFFPIFWVAVTAFKTEAQAYPSLVFLPTLETFREVFSRSNYLSYVQNS
jgi:sorbitol/mannitol transport system permease protein